MAVGDQGTIPVGMGGAEKSEGEWRGEGCFIKYGMEESPTEAFYYAPHHMDSSSELACAVRSQEVRKRKSRRMTERVRYWAAIGRRKYSPKGSPVLIQRMHFLTHRFKEQEGV